jgi:hypothetical protein
MWDNKHLLSPVEKARQAGITHPYRSAPLAFSYSLYVGQGDREVTRQIGAAIKEGMHPIVKHEETRMVSLLRFSVIK